MNLRENESLFQTLEMLWIVIAPRMGKLGEAAVYQKMFRDLHEQDDPLEYLTRVFELHRNNPPVEFERLLGMAMLVIRDEPEKPDLFRQRINIAQEKLRRMLDD